MQDPLSRFSDKQETTGPRIQPSGEIVLILQVTEAMPIPILPYSLEQNEYCDSH
jgi:hypothetical protein